VVETFPDCETHVRWISLGSERWKAEVGDVYGINNTTVNGAMPAFDVLPERDRRLVAFYERVTFGRADPATQRAACGLAETPPGSWPGTHLETNTQHRTAGWTEGHPTRRRVVSFRCNVRRLYVVLIQRFGHLD